jgi:hypothetical protein
MFFLTPDLTDKLSLSGLVRDDLIDSPTRVVVKRAIGQLNIQLEKLPLPSFFHVKSETTFKLSLSHSGTDGTTATTSA